MIEVNYEKKDEEHVEKMRRWKPSKEAKGQEIVKDEEKVHTFDCIGNMDHGTTVINCYDTSAMPSDLGIADTVDVRGVNEVCRDGVGSFGF